MRREWTNKIRFVLDELIPPIIRDSGWFMWPFYVMAYGKFSVHDLMNFKSRAYKMTEAEYAEFYGSLGGSISRRRDTDLNVESIDYLLGKIGDEKKCSVLDVGAGNGYLLTQIAALKNCDRMTGVDVAPMEKLTARFETYAGSLPVLPFKDKEFTYVICTHVMEHVLDAVASAKELLRIAQSHVLIVVPRQRYYYYTLDEHLNFYPNVEILMRLFAPYEVTVTLLAGDWALCVDLNKRGM